MPVDAENSFEKVGKLDAIPGIHRFQIIPI